MKSIDKPHDRFARAALSDVTVAADFLRAYLPRRVVKRIDFSTLELTNGSFIDEYCRQYYTDLVYACKIDKRDGYIILEIQSTPDPLMAFRIHSYVVDLLKTYLKQHPNAKKLPSVIGLCVYHGKKSPYPYSTYIYDCFEVPELVRRSRVFQEFQLIDLTTISEKEMTSHGTACLMEMLLKQSHTRDFVKAINILTDSPEHILKDLKNEYFNQAAQYMGNVGNPIIVKKALDLLSNALPEKKEIIMTYAQQLRKESKQEGMQLGRQEGMQLGRQEGMQLGRQEGIKEIVKNMLKQACGTELIAQVTGLSEEEINKLK